VAQPAPSVINWYFGPTAWDQRPDAMWHAACPDPYATGHDGEVWLDHRKGAFCTGCRHYEEGQAEQDIPPQRLAEIPPQPKPWEQPSPATPQALAAGYLAATQAVIGQTASTMPELPPEVESLDPTQDQPYTLTGTQPAPVDYQAPEPALADEQPVQAPQAYATEESHPGILARIEGALRGDGQQ
jgi:hypothetical protein